MNEEMFCQTFAIEEFLARKIGFYGQDPLEDLKIDMIRETYEECVRLRLF